MSTIDFKELFKTLLEGAKKIATSAFKEEKQKAQDDALNLLEKLKDNLKTWTQQLSNGEITKEDFEFLVLGQKDLLEMNALKQAGLALIRIDAFKGNLLNFIVTTISDLI
jgi:hypothetical protein